MTTTVYLPKDSLALTLNGSTRWPTAKELKNLGETRGGGAPAKIRQILDRIAAAIQDIGFRRAGEAGLDQPFRQFSEQGFIHWAIIP